jgi:glycine/D-amino acid oxidase-like deaminating enzyme
MPRGIKADGPAVEFGGCFLRLANLPNFAFDRLSRYEATLWRQTGQILCACCAGSAEVTGAKLPFCLNLQWALISTDLFAAKRIDIVRSAVSSCQSRMGFGTSGINGSAMHVGVLGGGLQGCCVALALADRGVKVTLFDKNNVLLSRAAVANEGKIHLGYMYAGDPTLSTAKTMMTGALSFAPFLERHLGQPAESFSLSVPAAYIVHRDSQHSTEEVCGYLKTVHALINEAAEGKKQAYFGRDLSAPLRFWSAAEKTPEFDPEIALAVISTPEIAINPLALAQLIRESIAAHPHIEIRCNHTIVGAVNEKEGITIISKDQDRLMHDHFEHAVNALWDGRLALNEVLGLRTNRAWLHRLKYGVSFRLPSSVRAPPSATFVLGPFGEVVTYADGLIYLTWYPECIQAISTAVTPPEWDTYPVEPLRSRIITRTFRALSAIVASLSNLDAENLPEVGVKGGAIVAWGKTDIYDPASELHRRFEIGVTSEGRFHSIDPGKLTMAPYFAEVCAERIQPSG